MGRYPDSWVYRGGFQKFLLTGVSRLLPKYYRSLDRPVPPPLLVLITALKSDYFLNMKWNPLYPSLYLVLR
jgi:hypothetical protein